MNFENNILRKNGKYNSSQNYCRLTLSFKIFEKKDVSLDIATTFPEFLAIHFQLDDISDILISHNHWT